MFLVSVFLSVVMVLVLVCAMKDFEDGTGNYNRYRNHARIYQYNGKFFLLNNEVVREIPDAETAMHLQGVDRPEDIQLVESAAHLQHIKEHEDRIASSPVPPIRQQANNVDEAFRILVLKIQVLTDSPSLVRNLQKLGWYFNACVFRFRGKNMILASDPGDQLFNYKWLDDNMQSTPEIPFDVGVAGEFSAMFGEDQQLHTGGDPRCIALNDTQFLISYAWGYPTYFPLYARLVANEKTQQMEVGLNMKIAPENSGRPSKNWMPFLFEENSIAFIENIHPLRVVAPKNEPLIGSQTTSEPAGHSEATVLASSHENVHLHWEYGSLRGGSNAKRIGKDKYLCLFHSRFDFYGRSTYFMGAMVFTSSPAFEVLAVSGNPIAHDVFYTGQWSLRRFYYYVVYPMSLFYKSRNESMLRDATAGAAAGDYFGIRTTTTTTTMTGKSWVNSKYPSIAFQPDIAGMSPIEAENVPVPGNYEITEPCDRKCLAAHTVTVSMGRQDREGWVFDMNLLELHDTLVHTHA